MTVLGISLGGRTTGIALIKDNELIEARTLTLRNKQTKHHTKTLDNYIQRYRVMFIVIKLPPLTHISERIKILLNDCLALFKYHGCMVEYKETRAVKANCPELKNKQAWIRFVSAKYPELTNIEQTELANRQKYHTKMFEAVLIAHITQDSK